VKQQDTSVHGSENKVKEQSDEVPVSRELRDRSLLAKPKKFDDYVTTAEAHVTTMNEPECFEEAANSKDRKHLDTGYEQ